MPICRQVHRSMLWLKKYAKLSKMTIYTIANLNARIRSNCQKKTAKTDDHKKNRQTYYMSKKQLPILYSKLLYKMGNYFLDT